MKKGTPVSYTTARGKTGTGKYIGQEAGKTGNWFQIKTDEGKVIFTRPSQVTPA